MDVVSYKSRKSAVKDEEVENLIVVPPDGGWSWVVVAAAFMCNLIVDGIIYTFGMFLEDISISFDVTVGSVTMVGSITTGFYYIMGPFVSALVNRYGFRLVAIFGSIIGAIGFGLSSISYDFPYFILTTGIGLGLIFVPTIIVVGFYFENWRALATGIATCGSGIGTLVVPPLITFLLDRIEWRNTYRVLACMVLLTGVLAIVYRPLIPVKVVQVEKEIKIIQDEDSIGSFELENKKCCRCNCRKHHNRSYPTTADIVPTETVILEMPTRSTTSSFSYTTFTTGTATVQPSMQTTTRFTNQSRVSYKETKCTICWRRCLRIVCFGHCQTVSRPMYRDDIFFGHSLMLLPQYKESVFGQSQKSQSSRRPKQPQSQTTSSVLPTTRSTGYHMSVTRVTTVREICENRQQRCACPLAVLRTLSTMLDFRMLKLTSFLVFSWSGFFVILGYMVPYLYIKDRAIESGISSDVAFWLISTIGAANTVGRIISGILPSVMKLKVILYSCICIAIAGISTALSGLFMDLWCQFLYATIYGIAGSCIATLRPIIVVDLFGLENLTNAFGLQLMFMGLAAFCGPTIAGVVYDATEDYNASFFLAGGCLLFSSILLAFVKKIRDCERRKELNLM